ncbi:MAG: hypothetical protein HZA12_01505 [Nitrospirae bacterium]|nr:hypothetical protein [Nitrospirota bacterium]
MSKKIIKTEVEDKSQVVRPFLLKRVNNDRRGGSSMAGADSDAGVRKGEQEIYNRGFTDGINAGRLQVLREIEGELKIVRTLVEGIERLKEEIYGKIEEDVVNMSCLIAKKIIYEITEHNRETVIAAAKEAIKRASDRAMLKIRINPVDYDTLNQNRSELLQCIDGIKSIIFEADESIQPGGCLIETNHGDVDARIDSQIRVMEGELRRVGR